jgi:hypothetical protein
MEHNLGDLEKLCDLGEEAAKKFEQLISMAKQGDPSLIGEGNQAFFVDGLHILSELAGSLRSVSRRVRQQMVEQVH